MKTQGERMTYTPEQAAWMLANKPLCYTGDLRKDIAHLPANLRTQ